MANRRIGLLEELRFRYPDGQAALHGVSLRVQRGEKVALVGPNGAGKSTLMLHLNGILDGGQGRVSVAGLPVVREHLPEIRARVAVSRGGKNLGVYMAGKNQYPAEGQTSNEVGIRTDWLRAEDLFLIGEQFNGDGSVVLKVLVNPLVDLIWLAGFVFLFGSLIAMWPDELEQRRLAGRTEAVPVTP